MPNKYSEVAERRPSHCSRYRGTSHLKVGPRADPSGICVLIRPSFAGPVHENPRSRARFLSAQALPSGGFAPGCDRRSVFPSFCVPYCCHSIPFFPILFKSILRKAVTLYKYWGDHYGNQIAATAVGEPANFSWNELPHRESLKYPETSPEDHRRKEMRLHRPQKESRLPLWPCFCVSDIRCRLAGF